MVMRNPMNTKVKGELEIDANRGIIYFRSEEGLTLLRICRLPKYLQTYDNTKLIDITIGIGVSIS